MRFFLLAILSLILASPADADFIDYPSGTDTTDPNGNAFEDGNNFTYLDGNEIKTEVDDNNDEITLLQTVIRTVPVGGTGVSSLTQGGIVIGQGGTPLDATSVLNNGQIIVGVTSADPSVVDMTGDVSIDSLGVTAVADDSHVHTEDSLTLTAAFQAVGIGTTAVSPTAAQLNMGRGFFTLADTGVVTVTLPDASSLSPGEGGCFYDLDDTNKVNINPTAGDIISLNGLLLDAGDSIENTPVLRGDFICVFTIDANTNWVTMGRSGTWIDGS